MEDTLKQMGTNLVDFFKSLEPLRRVGLVVLAGVLLAVMVGIISWAAKTQYKLLYTDLNKDDSTKIARILKEKNISYQLSNDGKTIRVPESQAEIFRLELAKMGTSFSGTVGYEIFDKQSFGTTNFVQKVNKQRALEGELMKTIRFIRGIKRNRVHLSIPETSPFVSEQKPPSASVLLDIEPGVKMNEGEIRGIQHLVAASVEGMRTAQVYVSNSRGKRLSDNVRDSMTAETGNRVDLEAKMNRRYERQIEDILGKVVGAGKVVAKVAVNLDFTESMSTQTNFDNENAAVVSSVTNKQSISGVRPSPQGIPGARSNLPGEKPQPGIPETRNDINKNLVTQNFNVPSKITRTKKPSATISNLSVAVMLDGKQVPVLGENGTPVLDDDGLPKTKYEQWTQAELENFQQIVSSTIGIKAKRGDTLVIKNMEFAVEDLSRAEAILRAREKREIIKNLTKYLAIGVLITLFFFVVIRPFIHWITENTVESIEDFLPKTIEELEKIQVDQKLPGLEEALPTIEEKLNPEKIEGNMLKEKIMSLVDANPAKAGQVVHDMIHYTEASKEIA